MNERIKELADKASQWVIDNSNGVHAPYEQWNEKFAELIVKECAELANQWQVSEHPGLLVRDVIKQHFGVE